MSDAPGDGPIIASQATEHATGKRKRKRLLPNWLVLLLFVGSSLGVFWAFYLDVARLGPTHFGLVVRGDQLITVYNPGQVANRIPIVDRLLILESTPRPLSSVRMSAPMADGKTAHVEIVVVFRYFDPTLIWKKWRADQQRIREGLDQDLRQEVRASIATIASGAFAGEADRRLWIERLQRHLTERWAGDGIVPTEMRLVQARIADAPKRN